MRQPVVVRCDTLDALEKFKLKFPHAYNALWRLLVLPRVSGTDIQFIMFQDEASARAAEKMTGGILYEPLTDEEVP